MDRRPARLLRRAQDGRPVQVRSDAAPRQGDRLVGLPGMQAGAVVGGIDRHAAHAEIGGRAKDADGAFAAIGDEQLLSGHISMLWKVDGGSGGAFGSTIFLAGMPPHKAGTILRQLWDPCKAEPPYCGEYPSSLRTLAFPF